MPPSVVQFELQGTNCWVEDEQFAYWLLDRVELEGFLHQDKLKRNILECMFTSEKNPQRSLLFSWQRVRQKWWKTSRSPGGASVPLRSLARLKTWTQISDLFDLWPKKTNLRSKETGRERRRWARWLLLPTTLSLLVARQEGKLATTSLQELLPTSTSSSSLLLLLLSPSLHSLILPLTNSQPKRVLTNGLEWALRCPNPLISCTKSRKSRRPKRSSRSRRHPLMGWVDQGGGCPTRSQLLTEH